MSHYDRALMRWLILCAILAFLVTAIATIAAWSIITPLREVLR